MSISTTTAFVIDTIVTTASTLVPSTVVTPVYKYFAPTELAVPDFNVGFEKIGVWEYEFSEAKRNKIKNIILLVFKVILFMNL